MTSICTVQDVLVLGAALGIATGIYRIASGFAQTMEENGVYEIASACAMVVAARHFKAPSLNALGAGLAAAALIKGGTNRLLFEEEKACYTPWRCAVPVVSWFFGCGQGFLCDTVRVTLVATKALGYGTLAATTGKLLKDAWNSQVTELGSMLSNF
jgi:hypothetical protein